MSDELRAAAERYRDSRSYEGSPKDEWYGYAQLFDDQRTLAHAYLAEHRADDEQPIDADWLRSVLDVDVNDVAYAEDDVGRPIEVDAFMCVWIYGTKIERQPKTRGDCRSLCRALGIELKEPA